MTGAASSGRPRGEGLPIRSWSIEHGSHRRRADSPATDVPRAADFCGSDPADGATGRLTPGAPIAAVFAGIDFRAPQREAPPRQPIATAPTVAPEGPAVSWRQSLPSAASVMRGTLIAWLAVSVAIAMGQAIRIVRFRRRLRGAVPAPDSLIDEAYRIGHWLGVDVPELLVVDNLGTPMLWCLGRPQLLLPTRLVKTLPLERWRGILTHELAPSAPARSLGFTARAGDRIDLVVEPVLLAHATRLDAEAELACDAWVVWALPKDRLAYAEALFDICSTMSQAKPMAPMLGVAGSGRFFERRLTMILHNCVPCRLSPLGLVAACLLLLAALPSWSAAKLVDLNHDGESTSCGCRASGRRSASQTQPMTTTRMAKQ